MNILFGKLMIVLIIGAILLFVLSFTVYRKSYYYKKTQAEMRDETPKPGLLSRLITIGILLSLIMFFVLVDLWLSSDITFSFMSALVINILLIALLSLFDALFIDYFVLLIWRPAFWGLPNGQPTRERMIHHIQAQFSKGWLFKVPVALLATWISTLLHNGS